MRKTATALFRFRRISALCAVLLAVMWVPLTSHELLESIEWIHHEADADHPGAAHESADGHFRIHTSKVSVKEPSSMALGGIALPLPTTSVTLVRRPETVLPVRRETGSPPGTVQVWQFALRLALPSRAPTFAV
ncbi:MAG TPA: hypothetical protein VMM36_16085 [Opitutaceae bacterium]|nr:hypothetical protein [Opitutaceae bacterium]